MAEETPIEGEQIGQITHYFGHIGVAVVELTGTLKVGDVIRIVGGEADFNQPVDSMEYEHQKIQEAKAGQAVGMKVKDKVHEGYKVYKV
jgi:translation elongation factor EF-Tu-like GTPase